MKVTYRFLLMGLLVNFSSNAWALPDCSGVQKRLSEVFKPKLNITSVFKGRECQVEVSKIPGHYTEDVKLVLVNKRTNQKVSISTADCGTGTLRSSIELNSDHILYHASESGASREAGGFYKKKWMLDIFYRGTTLDVNLENQFSFDGYKGDSTKSPNVNLKLDCEIKIP